MTISEPAIRRNTPGGFVSGCIGILGFRTDLNEDSFGIEWSGVMLGPNKSPAYETTVVSPMLVDPDSTTLYFTATDESMRAIDSTNGASLWERHLPANAATHHVPQPVIGVGDRLFVLPFQNDQIGL
jgi:hypothetical protein